MVHLLTILLLSLIAKFNLVHEKLKLKIVSATFLPVSFLSVHESNYQTRKSVFYFTSKALSVIEKIKF